ncbi:hypothetical protein BEP19_02950 [Ammoniphilus oxalaticus]|uniref:Uncharacterized protein n=1 Tax=Ammoniphilus oxalaticus TaxID=66863 RepID=A0A419SNT3_9BACL|nr:hypothetical protein [Ammoniphilus oxalaticus]RKD25902.1 hypothetical protein BEP19_02950 [Ammoniphilus oxalaticus]
MIFEYESSVGVMRIQVDFLKKRYGIYVDDKVYSYHSTVSSAAEAVYTHSTGYRPWDDLDGKVDGPEHLGHWQRIK